MCCDVRLTRLGQGLWPDGQRPEPCAGLAHQGAFGMVGLAHYTEDWKCRCNLFEFRQWCILVHRHMGARSWCTLQVCLQDGSTQVSRNLFQVDLLTTPAAECRSSPICTHVLVNFPSCLCLARHAYLAHAPRE